ncbi:hypothetical protein GQ53DRAFT_188664 [Thozetella sp. PMI_491]|nr:hypothetical protein GQ53DRAFT_188664 [Thozetella sp. PMI_491]
MVGETSAKDGDKNSENLLTLDPEQRGRKRRRSPMPFTIIGAAQTPSGESATFRGRRRHRSTSLVALSAFSSRAPSRSYRDSSYSPSRKRFLRYTKLDRRRSQSPSRSRSPDATEAPKRRRQRTRSRSRDHQAPRLGLAAFEAKSPLRASMAVKAETVDGDAKEQG